MRAAGGGLESQSRVDHQYGLCSLWVPRSLGRCVSGWVSGRWGLEGDRSTALHEWAFDRSAALRKTPNFKPKRNVLDPTWTARLTWHLPKRSVLYQ